ncbi:ATP:corrinoid adenosyltransferase BtuR/CobO/CobP [Natrialba chahannaoensis JCM 10990]|uniref:ATP:corrinoid adenosyltransferase BtuR/CobO/CobP n=1 Tax=Natrialba chahannaoensis JCM 10990 TaxID=1227492 RepID=M0AHW5_9EURY|nr:cob(I)yrinic acid a,c-diamide adenosyltransferase [Natrialba chahannaoensis]ELY96963.1 ATP:corrinoid adenosyltransferase BtuR/CobO/CobP [Natrialba chahannaoensis JCM 10990]
MCTRADDWHMSEEQPPNESVLENTPGQGRTPEAERIDPAAPEEFGLIQVWWGDGKGKTTATLGMGMRAAGHGYRVHVLQFMKGGASSVDAVRGEYNAIDALPGISYENLGHYGWHGMADGSDEAQHEAEAQAGLERAREVIDAAAEADLNAPLALGGDPTDGVHMLILDEVLYAVERGLISESDVLGLLDAKPDGLEVVLSGGHEEPAYLAERVDLITNVRKQKHPIEDGQRARRGTEF